MKTYDKASWHIDGGENLTEVVQRFETVFKFLAEKDMLTDDGAETLEYCMDSSVTLNSRMVTDKGNLFLDSCYDVIISKNPYEIEQNLSKEYENFITE